jgi:chromosome segregation ATPase
MASKEKYGINKNISNSLSQEECLALLSVLNSESSAAKLVEAYAEKNSSLAKNNAYYGRMRSQAERKLEATKNEYQKLEESIKSIEEDKINLERRRKQLEQERAALEAEVQTLSSTNNALASKVQVLTTQNDELVEANTQLKKDNKDLKNIVDQIRLRLARDTKLLLQYEDSEIRKVLIRLFSWTLG